MVQECMILNLGAGIHSIQWQMRGLEFVLDIGKTAIGASFQKYDMASLSFYSIELHGVLFLDNSRHDINQSFQNSLILSGRF
jgi:hypothetical protein